MPIDIGPSEIPVLLLFNLDSNWSAHEQEEVLKVTSQLDEAIGSLGHQTTLVPVTSNDLDIVLARYDPRAHIVFNWCESLPGINHSEWLVAEYLERRDFTFTGAGSSAIALAQDKRRVKQLLDESGIPNPTWHTFNRTSSLKWNHFPAIVKPAQEHCSEGIDRNAVVMTEAELKDRIGYIFEEFRQPALVEDFIDGRELHVSLWGNTSIDMLPPVEMEFSSFREPQDRICSYEAKFVPSSVPYQNIQTVLPAPLNEDELRDVEQACKAAYLATGCRDYARIDLRISDGTLYILDVNPNADISPDASTASAAEFAGYSYGELGSHIVHLAAQRHPVWGERICVSTPEGTPHSLNQPIR
ncbi:MAG: ATP-grasp domain-containing protein [Chloroflexota bacterium]